MSYVHEPNSAADIDRHRLIYDEKNELIITEQKCKYGESVKSLYDSDIERYKNITYKVQKGLWYVVTFYLPDGRIYYKRVAKNRDYWIIAEFYFEVKNKLIFEDSMLKYSFRKYLRGCE